MSDIKNPLDSIEEWEDDVLRRYPEVGVVPHQDKDKFRNYDDPARDTVKTFYRLNHEFQTLDFVQEKEAQYGGLTKTRMGVWRAVEMLNEIIDDSDPDTDLTQVGHALQTAEAIRADGHPGWFILVGLVHDLGKILCLWDEPQWAVVGDTFPVGCKWSDKIVYPEYFDANPDTKNAALMTDNGIYEPGCGLDSVHMSWGHDEYMYRVAKDYLPESALYMLRYHSFYAGHREHAYQHFMTEHDQKMFDYVRLFNPYDLYTKSPVAPDEKALAPFYQDLIAEFFPDEIAW